MTDNNTNKENTTHRFRRLVCRAIYFLREKKGGSASVANIRAHLEKDSRDVIPPNYRQKNAKGVGKWWHYMGWYAKPFTDAGSLTRKDGVWRIMPEGVDALSESEESLMDFLAEQDRKDRKVRKGRNATKDTTDGPDAEELARSDMEIQQGDGKGDIKSHILAKSADSQYAENLTVALLRALGYKAKKTPQSHDGGVDVIATTGELRVSRLFVQVKNQQAPVGEPPMRELAGVLTNKSDTDTGLFVSFSGFLPGSEKFAKSSNKHIELMDGFSFIELWCKHYDKLPDKDKALLPVKPIYFLDKEQLAADTPEK